MPPKLAFTGGYGIRPYKFPNTVNFRTVTFQYLPIKALRVGYIGEGGPCSVQW